MDRGTVVCMLTILVSFHVSWARLCCDEGCNKPISYGRTKDRYITPEAGYLSFPKGAIVTVLAKEAVVDTTGREMWLAEIQSRKGLIPAELVGELHTICQPKHTLEESVSKPHDDNEQHEYHSTASDIPLVQESDHAENMMMPQPAKGAQRIHEQENMVYQGSDELSEDQQQLEGYELYASSQDLHQEQVHGQMSYKPASDSAAALFNQSTVTMPSEEVGVPGEWHEQELQLEDPLSNSVHQLSPHGVLYSDDDNDSYDDGGNLSDLTGEHSSEYTYASSRQVSDGDETHNLQASTNELHVLDRVGSTDTIADDMYTNPKLPSDHVDYDVQGETDQSVMESSTDVERSELLSGTIESSPSRPTAYSMGDSTVSTTLPPDYHTPAFEELLPTQDRALGDSQVDTAQDLADHTQKQVTLRNGKVGYVQFLQDWTAQVTLSDGSTMNVDYDYFHGLDIDLPAEYDDYDYIPGATSGIMENTVEDAEAMKESDSINYKMESMLSEAETNPNVQNHEAFAQLKLEEHSPTASVQYETKSFDSMPHDTLHTSGEEHIHNYLNIHSLQQRYQHGRTSESPKVTLDTKVDYVVPDKTVFDESCGHSVGCSLHVPGHDDSSLISHPHSSNEHVLLKDTKLPPQESIHQPPSPVSQNELVHTTGTLYEELHHEETVMPQLSDSISVSSPPPEQLEDDIPSLSVGSKEWINNEFLPSSLSLWALAEDSELGVLGLIVTILAIFVPLCCSCCHFWRDGKRKATTISQQAASRKVLEEQIKKLKTEKNTVHTERLLLEERYSSMEHELEQVQNSHRSMTEAKADLEAHCESVSRDLSSLQEEVMQYKDLVDQLHSELNQTQMQLSAQTSDKEVAVQQITLLREQMKEYEQNVQELEATKKQLEEDSFSTQNSLQQMEKLHTQITQELADSSSENAQLKSKLNCLQEEVCSLQQTRSDNEQEIQTLKDCLGQVIQDEVDGSVVKTTPSETLNRIEAMLDTTKVQAKLQATAEERDKMASSLQEHTLRVKELEVENTSLLERIKDIESQLGESNARFQKLQDKHKTLTEYFEQKEHNLHRMLGVEEAVRQAVESREAQIKERAESLEETESRHKEELKQLRSEMFEIEKSLMSQVHTCQKRAEEAIAEQRRLEQENKGLKLEREEMRKRTSGNAPPPAAGPASARSHILHPPSAPYFPRTSSPGGVDSQDHDQMTSLLNQTDPTPGSLSVTEIPILSGNPNHSLQIPPEHSRHFPTVQGPLRHSPLDLEFPRYPPPRRIIPAGRGYPPFDRRHPIPPPHALYNPMHRYPRDTVTVSERRRPVSNPPPGARSTPPIGTYQPPPSSYLPRSSAGFVPVRPAVQPALTPSQEMEQVTIQRSE